MSRQFKGYFPDAALSRIRHWSSGLRIGSHTLPATMFLTLTAAVAAYWGLPFFSYLLGSGWVAPLGVSLLLFLCLVLFRKIIFRQIYKHGHGDGDTALLEYLVQHNNSNLPGEEEVEMELLENALQLKQMQARECMTLRQDIVHIDINDKIDKLRQVFINSSLSRIIVTDNKLDNVAGYVHVQQMLSKPNSIRKIVMPITFVQEEMTVSELLNKFIKDRTNIACVAAVSGGVAGLVSLEDVLEQLFGNIDDEHDAA